MMNKQIECVVDSRMGEAKVLDRAIRENAEALGYGR
ncbi:hypothetical protein PSDI105340_06540 [Pseudoalteromonas distincta]